MLKVPFRTNVRTVPLQTIDDTLGANWGVHDRKWIWGRPWKGGFSSSPRILRSPLVGTCAPM